ncbi:MAG: copper oxidase [Desulfuromonas sp.]|nr:copper oxidase [Desulfuromonas sp.]
MWFCCLLIVGGLSPVWAAPLPGGTLDPLTITKYVTPLVIPPVMPATTVIPPVGQPAATYDIAVRQFQQQVLPAPLPPTTVWSYGRAEDVIPPGFVAPVPMASGVSFNYPAFTVENTSGVATSVRWINDLVDPATGNFRPHLLPIDQTLHWANPTGTGCLMPTPNGTDCETANPAPYTGPVPLVTHVHGAHVNPDSDGYPEGWWLPGANNIPPGYVSRGSVFTQANNANTIPGSAFYSYRNDQAAATIWYHDHALGLTRANVYAGPAGFWLIRGGLYDTAPGVLPGPAPTGADDPNFVPATRANIREIPVVIQDRSFDWADAAGITLPNATGATQAKLFYPNDRIFFDGFAGPYIGNAGTPTGPSDLSGIWNPEFFANTMVVNGTTWPKLDVAQERYRLRLLNGCNSRTLNLSMFIVTGPGPDTIMGTADDLLGAEVPFYQIGGDQGFLPKVVKIVTGQFTSLAGNGNVPPPVAAPHPAQALLLSLAERADVIVDFSNAVSYPIGTRIRMFNTGPDAPFGGFPFDPLTGAPLALTAADKADPDTTAQVMDFVVTTATRLGGDPSTPPANLVLPAEAALGAALNMRSLSLNEMSSDQVCAQFDAVTGAYLAFLFSVPPGDPTFLATCQATPVAAGTIADAMGPREAVLGIVTKDGLGNRAAVPIHWHNPITEYPLLNSTEIWEFYNTTMDAHPIHMHLVGFQVVSRQDIDMMTLAPVAGTNIGPLPNERGRKDTVISYPGQVTRVKALFDIPGLYVWHCHILEHEDNEMMRPYMVIAGGTPALPATGATLAADLLTPSPQPVGTVVTFNAAATGGDAAGPYEYRFSWRAAGSATWTLGPAYIANATTWNWNTTGLGMGIYKVRVQTRHVGNPAAVEAQTVITFKLSSPTPATGVTLAPDVATPSPQLVGTAITFNAAATGGDITGPYEYRFSWKAAGAATWTVGTASYGAGSWLWNTVGLTPGWYKILVSTRHTGSPVGSEAQQVISFRLR